MPAKMTPIRSDVPVVKPRLATAAAILYLREVKSRRDPEPQPSQCRDVHAALMLSRHLAEAGYAFGESIVLAPDLRQTNELVLPSLGEIADFDFGSVSLVVQTTRPCLDDSQGQNRKPKYQSNHAIERAINDSLRRIFDWVCRERVSLSDHVPLTSEQAWLKNLAYGLYHKRQDSLAEATRWTSEGKQLRLAGITFGYIVFLRQLSAVCKPYLGLFGLSREDTFRLAGCLDRFPGLIAEMLSAPRDKICIIQMDRAEDAPCRSGNVRIAKDFDAHVVLDTAL